MIGARLRAERTLKLWLSIALPLGFCVPYFALQAVPVRPVHTLPLSWIDRAVGFSPGWVWTYQSVYLLIALVPWLAADRDTLHRYARGFMAMSAVGFLCFLIFPVAGPRPADVPSTGMFAVLVSYDRPLNAWPSLHCGLTAYTILLAWRMSVGTLSGRRRMVILGGLLAWGVLVCYATLATKQHYFADVLPGILLAWLCHRWAWRSIRVGSMTIPVRSRQASGA